MQIQTFREIGFGHKTMMITIFPGKGWKLSPEKAI